MPIFTRAMLRRIERLNKFRVNRIAKEMLEKTEAESSSMYLYLFQLADWGLEKGLVQVDCYPHTTSELSDVINRMMFECNPVKVMKLLTQEVDGEGPWVIPEEMEIIEDPLTVAQYLAQRLYYFLSS